MAEETARKTKNTKVGQVVSTKMNKTIVVEVTRRVSHPLYRRIVTRRKNFHAHDEENTCRVGDLVRIVESRPLSRTKRWRLDQIIRRGVVIGAEEAPAADEAAI